MGEVRWKDAFDRVEVIRYTGYDRDRGRSLEEELDRVGLLGFASNRWVVDSPFTARLAQTGMGISKGLGAFSEIVFGMYEAVGTALRLGAGRLLVLEDDIRFASDLSLVGDALGKIPDGFSSLRLSWMVPTWDEKSRSAVMKAMGVGPWAKPVGAVVKDTGAVAFSRDGMERFAHGVEESLSRGGSLGYCDSSRYYDYGGGMYVATPLLATQREYSSKMCKKRNYPEHYRAFAAPCGYG